MWLSNRVRKGFRCQTKLLCTTVKIELREMPWQLGCILTRKSFLFPLCYGGVPSAKNLIAVKFAHQFLHWNLQGRCAAPAPPWDRRNRLTEGLQRLRWKYAGTWCRRGIGGVDSALPDVGEPDGFCIISDGSFSWRLQIAHVQHMLGSLVQHDGHHFPYGTFD